MTSRAPRLACFSLGVGGGLLAGAGALATWQTITIGASATTKGIDTLAGKIALGLAVAAIVLTLLSRKGETEEPRRWPIAVLLATGIAVAMIGGLAQAKAGFIYNDRRRADAEEIAKSLGAQGHPATADQVLAQMNAAEKIGSGPGPAIVIAGGVIVVAASLAGFAWVRAWKRAPVPDAGEGPPGA